jgi:hypothetical protein
MYAQPDQVDT